MKCLVLCGGFGTRLYPLTLNKAKALLEYRGKPLVSHVVEKIPRGMDIMVSVNQKFEADFLLWQKSLDREVEICVEEGWTDKQKMGAVSSLNFWVEKNKIDEDLLAIAGDNYFEFDLARFISAYNGKNAMVAVYDIGDKDKATQFGVVQLEGNRIVKFEEKTAKPASSLIATACYILPPRIFPTLSQYCQEGERDNLGSFIAYLIETEEVHAYSFSELWVDIGSPEDLRSGGLYPGQNLP